MLSFTRKTDYALISLAHMVRSGEALCSAREIATHYGMPMPLLMNILKVMGQCGLIKSVRGPRGGYQLAKDPAEITLHDIIEAVDGPVALVQCLEKVECNDGKMRIGQCDLKSKCPVRGPVHQVHHRLVGFLKQTSLAEIAHSQAGRPIASGEVQHAVAHLS